MYNSARPKIINESAAREQPAVLRPSTTDCQGSDIIAKINWPAQVRTSSTAHRQRQIDPRIDHTMKKLGLVGGMSPEATQLYYKIINGEIRERLGGARSGKLLIESMDYGQMMQLFQSGQWKEVTEVITSAAQGLVGAGAQGIMICSNTPHMVANDVEKQLKVPFLHIADFTGQALSEKGLKSAALLGTKMTMNEDFFVGRLREKFGIDVLLPTPEDRAAINDNIFGDLSKMIITDETKQLYGRVVQSLIEQRAKAIVLACTELQFIVRPEDVSVPLFDTLELHAQGAAKWMLQT